MSYHLQLLLNGVIAGSVYALASSGLALTYGVLRILNFAHGHLLMVGAYLFYLFAIIGDLSLPWAGVLVILASIALSDLLLRVFVKPFLSLSPLLPLVTTMSLATILESVVSLGFGVNVKSLSTGNPIRSLDLGDVFITPLQITIICTALGILLTLSYFIHRTAAGRFIRAFAEQPQAAQGLGMNAQRIVFWVLAASGVLSSLAGILIGYDTNLQPTMGNYFTIKAFAAMMLGGFGNLWGTVVGSYVLGIVENLAIGLDLGPYSVPPGYKDAFAFAVILAVLLFRPQGLFGREQRVV